jgi:hypothetical protein
MTDKLYFVRKRSGLWTVWSHEEVCLNFRSYDEAIETAQTAATALSHEPRMAREQAASDFRPSGAASPAS